MNVSLIQIGEVLTLAALILGAYMYADQKTAQTQKKVDELEDCVRGELKELNGSINELRLQFTKDMTQVKGKLGIEEK